MEIRNICVFGVGAVGGYYGSLIARSLEFTKDRNVYFIARGSHMQNIQTKGLQIITSEEDSFICHPELCTDKTSDLPPCDLVLLAVKSYDIDTAIEQLKPIVHDNTVIIPLLNGIDIYERIRKTLSNAIVLESCVYVNTQIDAPGVIRKNAPIEYLPIGEDPHHPNFPKQEISELFNKANIKFEWANNIYTHIWSKFSFTASFALMTGFYSKSIGEIISNHSLKQKWEKIMTEIVKIAAKKRILLPDNLFEQNLSIAEGLPYEATTSYFRDKIANKRYNEEDLFGGTIIRLGKNINIPTPVTEMLYSKIPNQHSERGLV